MVTTMRAINKSTALGRIVKTDASCVINGRSYPGIPTLVWPEGVDEQASGWFRDLMTTNGVPASSAYEYAKILRPFLRFCRMRARSWDSVDDDFLDYVAREDAARRQGRHTAHQHVAANNLRLLSVG